MACQQPGPQRLRQQLIRLERSNLACGGCDSSRLVLSVPIWLAEAATAADFKGGLGGVAPQLKKLITFLAVISIARFCVFL